MEIATGEIIAGKYKIEKKIGEGATGIVYLAKDEILSKYAAIKFLRREYSSNVRERKRFLNEASIASHFVHESVVAIREVNEWRGYLYIIMDYHEGKTLKQILKERMLSRDEVYSISNQLLSCLDVAHKKNIMHRDIKPSNLMIEFTKGGNPKLKILDFGLAHCGESENTISGGTLQYVAPEQLLDDPMDSRSDLYSSVVCIYEMYTGVLPVDGATANEFIYNLLENNTNRPQPKRILFPPLKKVLFKGLSSDPELRYRNAELLWKELSLNLKFPYYEVIQKGFWIAGCLIVLWIITSFWKNYQNSNLQENYVYEAELLYKEQKYDSAIELAQKVSDFNFLYDAKRIICESKFAQIEKLLSKENFDMEGLQLDSYSQKLILLLQEHYKFHEASEKIYKHVEKKEYESALEVTKKYRGIASHQEIMTKQRQRLILELYRFHLQKSINEKNSKEAHKWYKKIKDKVSPKEKKIWTQKISPLKGHDNYEDAMYMGEYWNAMKIAKSFSTMPLWQNRYANAEKLLHTSLQGCVITTPIQGKILNRRIVFVQISAPDILMQYLKINNIALDYKNHTWNSELILPSGVQKIVLEYKREDYKYTIHEIEVHIDITPPVISVEKNYISSNSQEFVIVGNVIEDTRIDTIYFENYEAQPLNAAFDKWQLSIPLFKVTEEIQMIARDIAGNESYYKYNTSVDQIAPQIYIEFPKMNEVIYNDEIIVQGIVIDDSQIEEIRVMSQVIDLTTIKKGKWRTKITILPEWLDLGKATITIQAKDIWNNIQSQSVTVIAEYLKWKDISLHKKLSASNQKIWGLCYSPNGKFLVHAANDGRKTVWNTEDYRPITTDSIDIITLRHLKFSPAIRFNASSFAEVTGTSTKDYFYHDEVGGVWRVDYSDLKDRELGDIIRFFDYHISCAALSPDGLFLAMGHHSGNLRIIDLKRKKYTLHSNVHKGVILSLMFSSDGKWLASGGGDYKIKLWPVNKFYNKKLKPKHTLSGHNMSVTTLAFSQDNVVLASGSQDKSICLWDINKGKQITKLSGHTAQIECLSFSPVDSVLCSASVSGEMYIWK